MKKKITALTLCALLFALSSSAEAQQQPAKIPRIAVVSGTGNPNEAGSSIKIFRQALQELGYSQGKNILFEYRYTEGNRDRVPGIVAELVSLKVDILFSTQAIVIRAAKQATKTIPIEAGGLASYDAKNDEIFRRAAVYVDKILKGAKPADTDKV